MCCISSKIKVILALVIIFILGKSIYTQLNKVPISAKSMRLECHKSSVTFEKIIEPSLINIIMPIIKSHNYKISIKADKATYMQSQLFDYIDIQDIKKDFINMLEKYKSQVVKVDKNALFDITIYENDKKNPGKKTKKSKLYAGYIIISVKIENKLTYKIQKDFMDLQGKDINQTLSCIVKSIVSAK